MHFLDWSFADSQVRRKGSAEKVGVFSAHYYDEPENGFCLSVGDSGRVKAEIAPGPCVPSPQVGICAKRMAQFRGPVLNFFVITDIGLDQDL